MVRFIQLGDELQTVRGARRLHGPGQRALPLDVGSAAVDFSSTE